MLLMTIYCSYILLSTRRLHKFSCSLQLIVGNNHVSKKIAIKYWKTSCWFVGFFSSHAWAKTLGNVHTRVAGKDIQLTEKFTRFFWFFSAEHLIDYMSVDHAKQLKGNV